MLGRNIKKLRTEYEISQRRLADYMHIKEEQLQEWEQEKSFPNDEQLDRLATLFQVSVSELCDADESSNKQKRSSQLLRIKRKSRK